jgi:tetrahydromethanopterin S-methyltransferase subunit G
MTTPVPGKNPDHQPPPSPESLYYLILAKTLRLNSGMTGVVFGIVHGLVVFVVTNILVLKGPDEEGRMGEHLSLLSEFFVGYRVSFTGSLIGLGYGFLFGLVVGIAFSRIYNALVELRSRRSRIRL